MTRLLVLLTMVLTTKSWATCYISPSPSEECLKNGTVLSDLSWQPNYIQRQYLFQTSDVQNSVKGCRNYARLVQTECRLDEPSQAIYYSNDDTLENLAPTFLTTARNPKLPSEPSLTNAFKAYFAGSLQVIETPQAEAKDIELDSVGPILSFLKKKDTKGKGKGSVLTLLSKCAPIGQVVSDGRFMATCTKDGDNRTLVKIQRIDEGCTACLAQIQALLGRLSYSGNVKKSDLTEAKTDKMFTYSESEMPLLNQFAKDIPKAIGLSKSDNFGLPTAEAMFLQALKNRSPYTVVGNIFDYKGCSHTKTDAKGNATLFDECSLKIAEAADVTGYTTLYKTGKRGANRLKTITNDFDSEFATGFVEMYRWTTVAPIYSPTNGKTWAPQCYKGTQCAANNEVSGQEMARIPKTVAKSPFPLNAKRTWVLHVAHPAATKSSPYTLNVNVGVANSLAVSAIASNYVTVNDPWGVKYNLKPIKCGVPLRTEYPTFWPMDKPVNPSMTPAINKPNYLFAAKITRKLMVHKDNKVSTEKMDQDYDNFVLNGNCLMIHAKYTKVTVQGEGVWSGYGRAKAEEKIDATAAASENANANNFDLYPIQFLVGYENALPWGDGPHWDAGTHSLVAYQGTDEEFVAAQKADAELKAERIVAADCRSNSVSSKYQNIHGSVEIENINPLAGIKASGLTELACRKFSFVGPGMGKGTYVGKVTLACVNSKIQVRKVECTKDVAGLYVPIANGVAVRAWNNTLREFSPTPVVSRCNGNFKKYSPSNSCICASDAIATRTVVAQDGKPTCQVQCNSGYVNWQNKGVATCLKVSEATCRFKESYAGIISGTMHDGLCMPVDGLACRIKNVDAELISVAGIYQGGLCVPVGGTVCKLPAPYLTGVVRKGVCTLNDGEKCPINGKVGEILNGECMATCTTAKIAEGVMINGACSVKRPVTAVVVAEVENSPKEGARSDDDKKSYVNGAWIEDGNICKMRASDSTSTGLYLSGVCTPNSSPLVAGITPINQVVVFGSKAIPAITKLNSLIRMPFAVNDNCSWRTAGWTCAASACTSTHEVAGGVCKLNCAEDKRIEGAIDGPWHGRCVLLPEWADNGVVGACPSPISILPTIGSNCTTRNQTVCKGRSARICR